MDDFTLRDTIPVAVIVFNPSGLILATSVYPPYAETLTHTSLEGSVKLILSAMEVCMHVRVYVTLSHHSGLHLLFASMLLFSH
ncbi:hypothetical protein KIPB_013993 [Kipferlia bialata]|uniref:Uncharacterized protein n=1 Tax=Kipferlia bialata TaxID=797122 RepID=A0A9K3GQ11_9EUKA|nr:hypothetical protein KIPB_013993 [Kipferlia bialata]|eukprot:g13993.t1